MLFICGMVPFAGTNNAFYERQFVFDNIFGFKLRCPGAQGHPEYGDLRQVFHRSRYCPIRSRNLEGKTMPDSVNWLLF
jgi:hypothetical protein